jgi:hypothetical protein
MHSHYEILKDFAGPFATVVAAILATAITAVFAVAQVRIAKSQKDIALDKLKFDLLERRYKIYDAAKNLIEYISSNRDTRKIDSNQIAELYVTIDEARFYFDPDIQIYLKALTYQAEKFLTELYERDNLSTEDPKWTAGGELLASRLALLRKMYSELPDKFERALGFTQLKH